LKASTKAVVRLYKGCIKITGAYLRVGPQASVFFFIRHFFFGLSDLRFVLLRGQGGVEGCSQMLRSFLFFKGNRFILKASDLRVVLRGQGGVEGCGQMLRSFLFFKGNRFILKASDLRVVLRGQGGVEGCGQMLRSDHNARKGCCCCVGLSTVA
jgi:hypothetical protein